MSPGLVEDQMRLVGERVIAVRLARRAGNE